MTPDQHRLIEKARKGIEDIRAYLDGAMYYTTPQMPENEFKKVREAYDLICKSNDLLP